MPGLTPSQFPDEDPSLNNLAPESWTQFRQNLFTGGSIIPVDTLPVVLHREEIVSTVLQNPVTIISSPTGSGKTTEIPVMLMEAGIESVVVTQPRTIGAFGPASWVAKQLGETLGETVAFRSAEMRVESARSKIHYFTDGLELAREMLSRMLPGGVLMIDEAHEMNINQTLLMALARQFAREGRYRVIVSSATMPTDIFSQYFDDAPIVEIKMKKWPLVEVPGEGSTADMAEKFLRAGSRATIVFEAGEREIERTIEDLKKRSLGAVILPVHSRISRGDMERCFQTYDRPVIFVATNVVQTSVTLPHVDAVVDSGLAKYPFYDDGVEGLEAREYSLSEKIQRMGRANRIGPGLYCSLGRKRDEDLALYPIPEIQREPLDSILLKMRKAGFVANHEQDRIIVTMPGLEDHAPVPLDLLHEMPPRNVQLADELLERLRMVDHRGRLREIGHKVALLPVSPRMGRMIAHAEALEKTLPGIVDDVVALVSVIEEEGIIRHDTKAWRKLCQDERESDAIAQLRCFYGAYEIPEKDLKNKGIEPKKFERAKAKQHLVMKRLGRAVATGGDLLNSRHRQAIVECLLFAFEDQIFEKKGLVYAQGDSDERVIPRDSVVEDARLVVGIPFDLATREGSPPIRFLLMPTRVSIDLIKAVAPHALKDLSSRSKRESKGHRRAFTTGRNLPTDAAKNGRH